MTGPQVRVAGNAYGGATAASLEYAISHLQVKLVVVLGHEGCGAVQAAVGMSDAALAAEPPALRQMLTGLRGDLAAAPQIAQIRDRRARDREAVVSNVVAQMRALAGSELVRAAMAPRPYYLTVYFDRSI